MTTEAQQKPKVYTVSELTRLIKSALEIEFAEVSVEGEISNLRVAASGHCYFALKDEGAVIQCAMWRPQFIRLRFKPRDGQKVELRGHVSVFEARGQYQIIVEEMKEAGIGALFRAFMELKEKLQREGLFDAKHKKPIPFLPRRIGIVTSPRGAAIRDMLNIIRRRFANVQVIVFPVLVQGKEAPAEIVHAIGRLNEDDLVDVIIVGRGGGSIEDLWAFNDEGVARAIFASRIPIVSAVGHETDFTIADFVADVRAPTPSAAAELVVKNQEDLILRLRSLDARLRNAVTGRLDYLRAHIRGIERSYAFRQPLERLRQYQQRVDDLANVLGIHFRQRWQEARQRLAYLPPALFRNFRVYALGVRQHVGHFAHLLRVHLEGRARDTRQRVFALADQLQALGPMPTLERGYSVVQKRATNAVVRDPAQVAPRDPLRITASKGTYSAEVTETPS
jgi:exodeoxyribonuclease VII large subunit